MKISPTFQIVLKNLGLLVPLVGVMALLSLIIPLIFKEYFAILPLLVTAGISFALGGVLYFPFKDAPDAKLKHGMIIAGLGWIIVATLGSLPFFFIATQVANQPDIPQTLLNFLDPLNGFFESVSGYTGTGLTMTVRENLLPHTLQWWRSFTEWVGGVGVIVLMLSIIYVPGRGAYSLYYAEARDEKIHPSVISTVRTIWWIFALYTVASTILLWIAGMPLWHALNHAMTGIATGGFSVTDNSIATYDSPLIELSLIPIMIFGAISFAVHYDLLRGRLEQFRKDLQTRWLLIFLAMGVLFLAAENFLALGPLISLRQSLFQFVSGITCTGFQTADVQSWSHAAQLLMTVGMVLGGAAGSTAGGIKTLRAILLIKGVQWRFKKIISPPTALVRFRLGSLSFDEEQANKRIENASVLFFLWGIFLGVGIVILAHTVSNEYTLSNIIFEVASAQGNVGLSTGITGPGMSQIAKLTLCFNMWIGRLEIIPVLLLIRSIFHGVD